MQLNYYKESHGAAPIPDHARQEAMRAAMPNAVALNAVL